MPAKIRGRFAPGVFYSHVYRPDLGLSWQDAFQTDSQALVESYCLQHSHEFEWDGPILRTRYRQPAWRFTPEPRCPVWFNQAHLYHPASRDLPEASPTGTLEQDFPDNVLLSDGTQISEEDIATINRVYADCALPISWRPGDLLMVDNMLTAHGRMPYTGNHRMLVRMA
jgi:hypothetical protein